MRVTLLIVTLVLLATVAVAVPPETGDRHFSSDMTGPLVKGTVSSALPPHVANAQIAGQQLIGVPLVFTKNVGQWPDSIKFRASTGGTVLWFTNNGIWYQFTKRIKKDAASAKVQVADMGPQVPYLPGGQGHESDSIETAMVKAYFVGANPEAEVVGTGEQEYTCNYFLGDDPSKWHTRVPNYSKVRFEGIYLGVDAIFEGSNGTLSMVMEGPDETIANILVGYNGAVAPLTGQATVAGSTEQRLFQAMLPTSSASVGSPAIASLGANNVVLAYSTYLGVSSMEEAFGIAVDASGCAYVTGHADAIGFPTKNPLQSFQGASDVFVTKFSASGNSLIYSTYLGGTNGDGGAAIAIDHSNNVYVTGSTGSSDFPMLNAFQTFQGGTGDAFIAKLSPDGDALSYSTCFGGADQVDVGNGIAVDSNGHAFITGYTYSFDFPVLNPLQTYKGDADAFVAELSATGSSPIYSTFIGGTKQDMSYGIAVDGSGCAYITGKTMSIDYPVQNPFQTCPGGYYCVYAFVTKLSPSGNNLMYSTYLDGTDCGSIGQAIAVDKLGCAYVTGETGSATFPTVNAFQTYQGASDAFITKLTAAGSDLVYSTYLGGSSSDWGYGVALDDSCAYVTGYTASNDFPVRKQFQSYQGNYDAFITKLGVTGNSLVYSTCVGGNGGDMGTAVAVDGQGNAYSVGVTSSTNFPTQNPFQGSNGGGGQSDAFVTKIILPPSCCVSVRGNVNCTGITDLSDLSVLICYLTCVAKPTLCCSDAANINGTGIIDLSDLSMLIAYLTAIPRPTLPACP